MFKTQHRTASPHILRACALTKARQAPCQPVRDNTLLLDNYRPVTGDTRSGAAHYYLAPHQYHVMKVPNYCFKSQYIPQILTVSNNCYANRIFVYIDATHVSASDHSTDHVGNEDGVKWELCQMHHYFIPSFLKCGLNECFSHKKHARIDSKIRGFDCFPISNQ